MDLELTVVYEREGDWWLASILEIPGARSQGISLEDARDMVLDAAREIGFARRDDALRTGQLESETLRTIVNVPSAA